MHHKEGSYHEKEADSIDIEGNGGGRDGKDERCHGRPHEAGQVPLGRAHGDGVHQVAPGYEIGQYGLPGREIESEGDADHRDGKQYRRLGIRMEGSGYTKSQGTQHHHNLTDEDDRPAVVPVREEADEGDNEQHGQKVGHVNRPNQAV